MKKKIIFSGIAVVIVVAVLVFVFFKGAASEEKQVMKHLENHPELVQNYRKIQEYETKIKQDPKNKIGYLVSIGFEWKSLGDLSGDKYFYEKSLETYQNGAEQYGSQSVPFFWNAGKVAEILQRYDVAEFNYREAIRIGPSYNEAHRYLADLYDYKLNKPTNEVLNVYKQGLKDTNNDVSLFSEECSFLRRRKETPLALECYETLVKAFPENQGYKQIVTEIKAELKK